MNKLLLLHMNLLSGYTCDHDSFLVHSELFYDGSFQYKENSISTS